MALQNGQVLVPQVKNLQQATLIHDAIVASVRLRLGEFWPDAKFIPERAIKGKEFRQIPDGIFFFSSGKGIAIEVENSDKGRSRFLRLLGRWREVNQILLVLFIATHEAMFQTLRRYLEDAPQEQPMGLVHWDQLKTGKPLVWTPKGEIPIFERRTF